MTSKSSTRKRSAGRKTRGHSRIRDDIQTRRPAIVPPRKDDKGLRQPGMDAEQPEDASVEQVCPGHYVSEVVVKWDLAMKDPNPMFEVKGFIERYDEGDSSEGEGAEIEERQCGCKEREKKRLSNVAGSPWGWLGFHLTPLYLWSEKYSDLLVPKCQRPVIVRSKFRLVAMAGCVVPKRVKGEESRKKQKGDSLARDRPCLPNFRRSGSDPDHNYSSLRSYSGRTSLARRIAYPVITFRCKSFLVPSQRPQFPECCVSLVSDSLADFLSDPLAGFVSDALPEFRCRFSLQTSFPILIRSSFFDPCGLRFRFRWRSFPVALANSASGSPMALVYSLLLEDCSSVELKDISRLPRKQGG